MPQLEPISNRLSDLEAVIDRGRRSFIEVGLALLEIRDGRLYKERGYTTFDDYVRDHLGFQRRYAGYLIEGAKAVAEVGTIVPTLPANEGQARELARVPEGQRVEVWQKVVESGAPVTATRVRFVAETLLGDKIKVLPDRELTPEEKAAFAKVDDRPRRQAPDAGETFRGMLTNAVSYGIVVAELDPDAVRRMFEEALRDALRDLKEMA